MPSDVVDTAASIIQKATGLTMGQAKTGVYYASATYRLEDLNFIPALDYEGPAGTGKSTCLRYMKKLCYRTKDITDCDQITLAALRDKMVKARFGTFIAEEADGARNPSTAESLFRARCSKDTARLEIKQPKGEERGWSQKPLNIFGASVLHRRQPFRDQAVQSRVIIIRTRFRDGPLIEAEIEERIRRALRNLAKNVDLKAQPAVPGNIAGRVIDVWRPLLLIAQAVKDKEWLLWAWNELQLADAELHDGHGYEPGALILARVVELLSEESKTGSPQRIKPQSQMQRIKVDADIVDYLRKHSLPYTNAWQVSRTLKNLGFEVQRTGGVNYLLPTVRSLLLAAQKVGYEDKLLGDIGEQEQLE